MATDWEKLIESEAGSYGLAEWTGTLGGQEVTLYSKPVTSADITRIQKKGYPDFPNVITPSAMVEMICLKATDAAGQKPLRNVKIIKRMQELLRPAKISEIASALFEDALEIDETDEEFEARVEK